MFLLFSFALCGYGVPATNYRFDLWLESVNDSTFVPMEDRDRLSHSSMTASVTVTPRELTERSDHESRTQAIEQCNSDRHGREQDMHGLQGINSSPMEHNSFAMTNHTESANMMTRTNTVNVPYGENERVERRHRTEMSSQSFRFFICGCCFVSVAIVTVCIFTVPESGSP